MFLINLHNFKRNESQSSQPRVDWGHCTGLGIAQQLPLNITGNKQVEPMTVTGIWLPSCNWPYIQLHQPRSFMPLHIEWYTAMTRTMVMTMTVPNIRSKAWDLISNTPHSTMSLGSRQINTILDKKYATLASYHLGHPPTIKTLADKTWGSHIGPLYGLITNILESISCCWVVFCCFAWCSWCQLCFGNIWLLQNSFVLLY